MVQFGGGGGHTATPNKKKSPSRQLMNIFIANTCKCHSMLPLQSGRNKIIPGKSHHCF